MANLNSTFSIFNNAIRLSDADRKRLISVRNSLRTRMRNNFNQLSAEVRKSLEMFFQSQGSFVMDTIIKPEHDDFDLDDGIYFLAQLGVMSGLTPVQLHDWVLQAIDSDNDYEDIEDKPTCIRVSYKQGFHIDLPSYVRENDDDPYLSDTKRGWTLSNPVEFIEWFENHTNSGFRKEFIYDYSNQREDYKHWLSDMRKMDCQLRRIVRYLKVWADLKRKEMPCGLIMSILAVNNYVPNDRDDVSLKETLQRINTALKEKFECKRPTAPIDEDLFLSYPNKDYFMNALDKFAKDAQKALEEINYKQSSELWIDHLGSRFPLGRDEDDQSLVDNSMRNVITQNHKPYAN